MDVDKIFQHFPNEKSLMNVIMHTSTTVWNSELGEKDIEGWLSNFKGDAFKIDYERKLALWLLSHFTFYNENEVKHLCKVIYRDLIHHVVKSNVGSIKDIINNFFKKSNIIL